MSTNNWSRLLETALAVTLLAPAALAQDSQASGEVILGWRAVDVSGSEGKYRQHFNLDEGARLFEIDFDLLSPGDFADRVSLDVHRLGGDPFETIDFEMRKFGTYRLQFSRRSSDYFYEDVLLPPERVNPRLSNGGDFHHFDFQRVRDTAQLELQLKRRTSLLVGFERFSREGESTTVFDVSRDEFELDQPIDESMDRFSVALEMDWDRATLVLEETRQVFEQAYEVFLPGRSEGENPGPAILDTYFFDQPIDSTALRHSARLSAKPRDDVIVSASLLVEDFELDFDAAERGQGVSFQGSPLVIDDQGNGNVQRDMTLFDVDASWLLNDRLALVGGVRRYQLDQDGRVGFAGSSSQTEWELTTTAAEAGLEIAATSGLTVSFGVRQESRDVDHGPAQEGVSTEHLGGFATAQWQPRRALKLQARYERSTYDDPFTLASPTDRERLRLSVRYRPENGAFLQGTYLQQQSDNDNSLWQADYTSLSVRGGVRRAGLELSGGYSRIDVERSIDQTVTTLPGFGGGVQFDFPIFFGSDTDLLDLRAVYRFNERFEAGVEARAFDNAGSFANDRHDVRLFARQTFAGRYLLHASYREIDYEEDVFGLNDYAAEILELGVGYRF